MSEKTAAPDRANVRAARFYLLRSRDWCRRCALPTAVHALALPAGHGVLELDDGADDDSAEDTWGVSAGSALLFEVTYLADSVRIRLAVLAPNYRSAGTGLWVNHCEHCGCSFEDQDLFCEPGAAFLPWSDAEAERLRCIAIDAEFWACAAGYAPAPPFLKALD